MLFALDKWTKKHFFHANFLGIFVSSFRNPKVGCERGPFKLSGAENRIPIGQVSFKLKPYIYNHLPWEKTGWHGCSTPDVQHSFTNSPHLLITKCPLFYPGLLPYSYVNYSRNTKTLIPNHGRGLTRGESPL